MSDAMKRQTSDAANAAGFGTSQLSERQAEFQKAGSIKDGGASAKGFSEPATTTGTR